MTRPPDRRRAHPERAGRTVTAEDVARLAGVSRSAVSRTFTDGASVAPATREKVLTAARELGYRVNHLARSLQKQQSDLVGLVVSDMDHSFRARLVDLLSRGLVARNYRPFMLPAEPGEDPARLIDMMLHYNVAGTIVTSDTPPAVIVQECQSWGVPLVLVNKAQVTPRVANVSLDCERAGTLIADALAEAGCRRVAVAGQSRPSHTIGLRKEAFRRRAAELGLEITGEFTGPAQNYQGGVEAARAFLAGAGQVDGVHCVNDYLALGFMDHLRRVGGVSIPGDLKIASCDDIAEASWLSYDLTTVRQDAGQLATLTLEALAESISHPGTTHAPRTLGVELVRRGSTGAGTVEP